MHYSQQNIEMKMQNYIFNNSFLFFKFFIVFLLKIGLKKTDITILTINTKYNPHVDNVLFGSLVSFHIFVNTNFLKPMKLYGT